MSKRNKGGDSRSAEQWGHAPGKAKPTPKPRPKKRFKKPETPAVEAQSAIAPGGASEKIQKVLARAGLGSRRGLEKIISDGQVTVNGEVATLGDRIDGSEKVTLQGRAVRILPVEGAEPRVIMINKSEGVICTRNDPEGRETVFDSLPSVAGARWVAVGRLDLNTAGLLLMTTDGELANKLMHPSGQIEREYRVRLFGDVDAEMTQRLLDGVQLDDGMAKFSDITLDGDSSGKNHWATVTLCEGRNREVRRLWESQGVQVSRLKRVRYGPIFLPSRVKRGQWGECTAEEIASLRKAVEKVS